MRQALIVLALLAVVMIIGFGAYHLGEYQSQRLESHMKEVADEVADSILTDWGVEDTYWDLTENQIESRELHEKPWRFLGDTASIPLVIKLFSGSVCTVYWFKPERLVKPDPCPPCSVCANWLIRFHRHTMDATYQVKLDTFFAIHNRAREEASFWKYAPDTAYQMPPGMWVKTEDFYRECLLNRAASVPLKPDSVFILSPARGEE